MENAAKPEEFDLSRWSIPQLKKLEPAKLHRFTQHIIGTLAASRILLGRCLLAIDATGLYAGHGFSDSIHYAVSHGIDEREGSTARRTARYLEELPKLSRAAEKGEVSWSALKAITPKATADTEERWLDLAQKATVRTVEKIAARTGHGEMPGEQADHASTAPKEVQLHFSVAPEVAVLFQQTVRDLSKTMGQRVTGNQALELLVVSFHTAADHADDATVEKLIEEARRDVAAEQESEQQEVEQALSISASGDDSEETEDKGVSPPPDTKEDSPTWATDEWGNSTVCDGDQKLSAWAATVTRLLDDPDGRLKLVARSRKKARSKTRFNAKARGVTPAQRKELLRRDGYCCSTPGCRRHLWLDVHHLVFYCHQGPTVPENLVILCQRYVTPHLCDVGANQHSLFPATK